jgi:hypothetical protein
MWNFIAGFTAGVYVGTYYDCKPVLNYLFNEIKKCVPEKKEE